MTFKFKRDYFLKTSPCGGLQCKWFRYFKVGEQSLEDDQWKNKPAGARNEKPIAQDYSGNFNRSYMEVFTICKKLSTVNSLVVWKLVAPL
jgi:hypothetical protein